jgi:hypothetical protein
MVSNSKPTILCLAVALQMSVSTTSTLGQQAPQAAVEGVVTSRLKPVVGAVVEIRCPSEHLTAITDSAGRFRFENRPRGHCTISVDSAEFIGITRTLTAAPLSQLTFELLPRMPGNEASMAAYSLGLQLEAVQSPADRPRSGARFESLFQSNVPDGTLRPGRWIWHSVAFNVGDGVTSLGVSVGASSGRHLPAYAVDGLPPAGSDAAVTGQYVWNVKFSAGRRLFGSDGGPSLTGIVEGYLPIGPTPLLPSSVPASVQPIRSRAFKVSFLLAF